MRAGGSRRGALARARWVGGGAVRGEKKGVRRLSLPALQRVTAAGCLTDMDSQNDAMPAAALPAAVGDVPGVLEEADALAEAALGHPLHLMWSLYAECGHEGPELRSGEAVPYLQPNLSHHEQ